MKSGSSIATKLLEARPNEPALADIFYDNADIDHIGLVPDDTRTYTLRIPMAKHHVISWKILRNAWNKAEALPDQEFLCKAIYRVMAGTATISDTETTVRQKVCWSNGNLIIGPEGNIRLFDPGEDIDFEYPAGMAPDRRQRVLDLVKFGSLLKEYQKLPKKNIDGPWKARLEDVVARLERNNINICVFDRNA